MLLVIDIGNTTIKMGVFDGEELVKEWSLTSGGARTADEAAMVLGGLCSSSGLALKKGTRSVVASVVPSLTGAFVKMTKEFLGREALVLTSATKTDIAICYRDPASVGADRIANAVAASKLHGLPAIVVDLGTATTFDVITEDRRYLGGVIAPGLVTSAENLFAKGAKLAPVEFMVPSIVIGRTTEESLLSGIMYGTAGQVDAIVGRIESELGGPAAVIGTGGYVEVIAPLSRTIKVVDPALTLHGLRLIAEMNV